MSDHGFFVRYRTFQAAMYRAISDDREIDWVVLRGIIDRMDNTLAARWS